MDKYRVPLSEIRRDYVASNSRFISTLGPAFSIDEARSFLTRIKGEFADASHNVSAYLIGGGNTVTEYFSDDGEPSGTAGKPALAVLRGSGLGDVVLVITRYFGGTLLGKGGLVKAYTESAQIVVNEVQRGVRVAVYIAVAVIPYNLLERVRLLVIDQRGIILGEEYAGDITLSLQIPTTLFDAFQSKLGDLSAGRVQAETTESRQVILPV